MATLRKVDVFAVSLLLAAVVMMLLDNQVPPSPTPISTSGHNATNRSVVAMVGDMSSQIGPVRPTPKPLNSPFILDTLIGDVPSSRPLTNSDVAVCVLTRRSAFDVRKAIRETWAAGRDNVYFVMGTACKFPPSHRAHELTCEVKPGPLPPNYFNMSRDHTNRMIEEGARLEKEQYEFGDLLITRHVDSYRLLPQKLKACYEFVSRYLPSVRWVLKADDDFFVRLDPLSEYLRKSLNASEPVLMGAIVRNGVAPTGGKWKELPQFPSRGTYPPFPLGSRGHVVSRPVAEYVTYNRDLLFDFQGEDVSIGIWLDQSPLKVNFVNDQIHMKNDRKCTVPGSWVIGHDVTPQQMRMCNRTKPTRIRNKRP